MRVYGLTFPSCADSDDRTAADLEIVSPPTSTTSSTSTQTEQSATPSPTSIPTCVVPQPAYCDQVIAERDRLVPGNVMRLRIASSGSAAPATPIVIFNATVLMDGAFAAAAPPVVGSVPSPTDSDTPTVGAVPRVTIPITAIVVPALIIPLAVLVAIAAGRYYVRRRRSRNASESAAVNKGVHSPYMLHATSSQGTAEPKRA